MVEVLRHKDCTENPSRCGERLKNAIYHEACPFLVPGIVYMYLQRRIYINVFVESVSVLKPHLSQDQFGMPPMGGQAASASGTGTSGAGVGVGGVSVGGSTSASSGAGGSGVGAGGTAGGVDKASGGPLSSAGVGGAGGAGAGGAGGGGAGAGMSSHYSGGHGQGGRQAQGMYGGGQGSVPQQVNANCLPTKLSSLYPPKPDSFGDLNCRGHGCDARATAR